MFLANITFCLKNKNYFTCARNFCKNDQNCHDFQAPEQHGKCQHILCRVGQTAEISGRPTIGPTPGPELVIQAITALNAVSKDSPLKATKTLKAAMLSIYPAKNTKTDETTALLTVKEPTFIGKTRLGSVAIVKDLRRKAKITCQRKIFIEPEVDPVQPPVRAKMINNVPAKAPHCI